jgi:hypothetical protein
MATANNYRVPGKKMTSRFGMSHRELRAVTKYHAAYYAGHPDYKAKHYESLPKRLAKKCKHPKMRDEGYGGPNSGCIDLHCPHCGFSHHVNLY